MVKSQSSYSRTLANDGKLGAYYTDSAHCESIASFLSFGKKTLILEPAIGDASAVKLVVRKQADDEKLIFGIELNKETFEGIKGDPLLEAVLNADALHGTKISNGVFPFCFSNPPYGEITDASEKSQRLEKLFLERIFTLMRTGGILVYVIPEYLFKNEGFAKALIGRYEPIHLYRFRQPEYNRFKQCVFIGRRRSTFGWMPEWIEEWLKKTEDIDELPVVYTGEPVVVPDGDPEMVKMFTNSVFHPEDFLKFLGKRDMPVHKISAQALLTEPFRKGDICPPIRLKKNHLYLLAVSGEGQGMVGDEDEGTLHLQRGSAKRVSKSIIKEDGEQNVEVVTTSTQISLKIVEADGTIAEKTISKKVISGQVSFL